jgi:hypothetical protein
MDMVVRPQRRIRFTTRQRLTALGQGVLAAALFTFAVAVVGPLAYDPASHAALNRQAQAMRYWGNQLWGFDITQPRQNLFSLVRDMADSVTVVDHGMVYSSRLMGLMQFVSRGRIFTVADALSWYNVPLTAKQAQSLRLCRPLDELEPGEDIIVQADPWQRGVASWYGPGFHGRLAASGEIYSMYDRTAAHKTLPLQSMVRVVSQRTGQSVVVRINDRGPYVGARIIDMSHRAKELLGMEDLAAVYIERIDMSALDVQCVMP